MKYLVKTNCAGFRGIYWERGTIVDIDPEENPPKHFEPIGEVESEKEKPVDPRAPVEVEPGKNRSVTGGFAATIEKNKLDRVLTTDKVPNGIEPPPIVKVRRRRKKKGVGSVKKSD